MIYILVGLLVLLPTLCAAHRQEVYGRSYLYTRPGYSHLSTHNQLWHEIIYQKKGSLRGAYQMTPFVQQSLHTRRNDHYFLIHGKEFLLISGDANTQDLRSRDVRAEWLELPSNFRARMSLQPHQKEYGVLFEYHQDLCRFIDLPFFKDWQVSIQIPMLIVDSDLAIIQHPVDNSLPSPEQLTTTFNNPAWLASKIHPRSSIGVPEIKLMLESPYMACDKFIIAYHSVFSVPTKLHTSAKYMFDAVLGNNGHVGIGGGVDMQFPLNRDIDTFAFCYFISLESVFLIRNLQHRTFDLKGKPWSRFLQYVNQEGDPATLIPGVNILTRQATIRPHATFDFTTGWRFLNDRISFEFGYNIWGHDREIIEELNHPLEPIYGIAAATTTTSSVPITASQSTISMQAAPDQIFIPITKADIDLHSGAAGSALSHKVHVAFGIKNIGNTNDVFFGIGGFIDIPQKNGSLKNWGAWAKIGAAI